jgi:anti-sigma factor RsiW
MTFGCDETKRWLDAWVDQELDLSASVHVESHLTQCKNCHSEANALKSLKRSLAGLREESCPTALRFKISAALDACEHEQEVDVSAAKRKKHALGFAITGAALAGVVLATGHRPTHGMMQAGMLPVVEDIAQRHAHELPAEVEASDPSQVARWFRGKLDIPVHPVMFRNGTARLLGARISTVQNQMAAALFYDVGGGRRMTVFVFDSNLVRGGIDMEENGRRQPYIMTTSHGYTVTLTEQQGVAYAIASDLPPQETVRIVQSVELR